MQMESLTFLCHDQVQVSVCSCEGGGSHQIRFCLRQMFETSGGDLLEFVVLNQVCRKKEQTTIQTVFLPSTRTTSYFVF